MLDWVVLLTGLLAVRRAPKQEDDLVLGAVSGGSHHCCHMLAAHRSGRSSAGSGNSVFVGTVGQQDSRGFHPAVVAGAGGGTAEGRTSATTACLWNHCCRYASGIRGLVVGVAELAGCCWRPRRCCSGCPPTQESAPTGTMRSRLSRSYRGFRLVLRRILSADGDEVEMA